MSVAHSELSANLGTLQSLDDAIAFRRMRLELPCPDCTSDQKCDDHACDVFLVARYKERQESLLGELFGGMDPNDVALVAGSGGDMPPTVSALSIALLALLREDGADASSARDCEAEAS